MSEPHYMVRNPLFDFPQKQTDETTLQYEKTIENLRKKIIFLKLIRQELVT